jgi:DNA-binding transcriptional regulator LsrR (DeoR family)
VIAFDARRLDRVPIRIGVAGGPAKVRPILGALRAGALTVLVSDVRTAEAVVALDAIGAAA